jgi:hypothetical protein|tara:strand:+ start:314 stop:538 length:225 start_codon:yes stop_codon:yes gene_type:complete
MRSFLAKATVSFDVIAGFELTDTEYKRAITKYGDLDTFAANEIKGDQYTAGPESDSDFQFRAVMETTLKKKITN